MKINYRKAEITDYKDIKLILDESDDFHRVFLPSIFQDPHGNSWREDYVNKIITGEDSVIYLATDNNQIIGAMVLLVKVNQPLAILKERRFVMLDCISIKKEYQNRAIGKDLLSLMEVWAVGKGISEIELNVYEFNRNAIRLYEKLGFTTYSRRMHKSLINDD
jgi:diamine N-acetyltransferase